SRLDRPLRAGVTFSTLMLSRSLIVATATAVGSSLARAQTPAKPTGEPWQIIPLAQSTLVFARDSSPIGEIGRELRTSVALNTLPKYVWQAFVAVEDERFFKHNGVDYKAVGAAVAGKIFGNNRGGGSTITQQLVGYMHPDVIDRTEVSGVSGVSRKYHEQQAAL